MNIRTISVSVITIAFIAAAAIPALAEGDKAKGAELYKKNCAGCHGVGGAGDGSAASSLSPKPASFVDKSAKNSNGKTIGEITDDEMASAISNGKKKTAMPKFKKLSEQDVKDLVAYIRSL